MLDRLLGWFGLQRSRKVIVARYDAAQTNDDNRKHWSNADSLSATGSVNPYAVKKLRDRARYEYRNNSYCSGPVQTYAHHLIGTGPMLDVQTEDEKVNEKIEQRWHEWADEINAITLFDVLSQAKVRDGDGLGLLSLNPNLKSPVKLNLLLRESDQLDTPLLATGNTKTHIDGIEFDAYEQPTGYWFRRSHPGDPWQMGAGGVHEFDLIPANRVIHWYRMDRPGQVRGASELSAALPLFAQLRRFTQATLSAAETAASFAALIESDIAADAEELETVADFDTMEITRGMMTKLPANHRMSQLKAEHPTTTYAMFVAQLLKEIGRGLHMPYNIFAGDSSQYNLSSARLDVLLFRLALIVNRDQFRRVVLNRLFAWWLSLARLVPGFLPEVAQSDFRFNWRWPGFPSIDPLKDAQADTERLRNNTATLEDLYAQIGKEWKRQIQQRGREMQELETNGVKFDEDSNAAITSSSDIGSGSADE